MSGMYKDAPAEFGRDVPQIGLVVSFLFLFDKLCQNQLLYGQRQYDAQKRVQIL